jgi:hypothetical protein
VDDILGKILRHLESHLSRLSDSDLCKAHDEMQEIHNDEGTEETRQFLSLVDAELDRRTAP